MTTVSTPARLLLVEDNPGDVSLIREMIHETSRVEFEIIESNTLAGAIEILTGAYFDAILLDLSLPDAFGIETLQRIQEFVPGTPIIVLSGFGHEEFTRKVMREGAQDYLLKGQIDSGLLVRSIRCSIERKAVERRKLHLQGTGAVQEFSATIERLLVPVLGAIEENLGAFQKKGSPASADAALKRVSGATKKAEGIIHQLRFFCRGEVLDLEAIDLNRLVKQVTEQLAPSLPPGVRIKVDNGELVPSIQGDATMLAEALAFLIVYLQDAMTSGGEIVVQTTTESVDSREVQFSPGARAGEFACVSIFADGQEIICDPNRPFVPNSGPDLGFAAAYWIIWRHRGWLQVMNHSEKGSSVAFFLPLGIESGE